MASIVDSTDIIPQWKKDLIARLRNQNKCSADKIKQLSIITAVKNSSSISSSVVTVGSNLDPPFIKTSTTSVAVGQTPNVINLTSTCSFSKSSTAEGNASETVCCADTELCSRSKTTINSSATCSIPSSSSNKMVQERIWLETKQPKMGRVNGDYINKNSDSSDSEDLQYGPGIVNKLKNKYLSLALRENNNRRPSILRKAASLENILDDDSPIISDKMSDNNRKSLFQSRLNGSNDTAKNVSPNRYRNAVRMRAPEMKRARSVEAISTTITTNIDDHNNIQSKRESMHEDMLITNTTNTEGNDKDDKTILDNNAPPIIVENNKFSSIPNRRLNKPKRIAPMMNEREKPPVDVVKQTKLIFEKRPEHRTKAPHSTGEVAAKVATYKNIIVKNKSANIIINKPPIKTKPIVVNNNSDKQKITRNSTTKPTSLISDKTDKKKLPKNIKSEVVPVSPIPDVSMIEFIGKNGTENSECGVKSKKSSLSETPDLILTSSLQKQHVTSPTFRISATENFIQEERRHSESHSIIRDESDCSSEVVSSNTIKYNFIDSNLTKSHLPTNRNVLNNKTPPNVPLKLEINGIDNNDISNSKKTYNNTTTRVLQMDKKDNTAVLTPEVLSPKILSPVNQSPKVKSPVNQSPRILSPVSQSPRVLSPTTNEAPKIMLVTNTKTNSISPRASSPTKTPTFPSNNINTAVVKKEKSLISPPSVASQVNNSKVTLTNTEIEKNLKNNAKSLSQPQQQKQPPHQQPPQKSNAKTSVVSESADRISDKIVVDTTTVNKIQVPNKVKRTTRASENSCMEYNFTDRKGTPDYIRNDTSRTPVIERPKAGESGIILLPGASIGESFTDEEDEIFRSLEAPPSPCDVKFINDNILIDGKSSLSQKTKKPKMRIKFVDDGPEIFEYPSETSMLIDDLQTTQASAQVGHSVPQLSGSSLANYTPKGTEEFQPGVSRHIVPTKIETTETADNSTTDSVLQELDEPILFSSGTNSDILF